MIFILIDRIDKTKLLAKSGIISNQSFLEFDWLRVDITYLHYEMRSIMDYICQFLEKYFDIEIKGHSYNELLKVRDKKRLNILGTDLVNLIGETDKWFGNLRETRKQLIHDGKIIHLADTQPEFSLYTYYLIGDVIAFLPHEIATKIKFGNHAIYCVPYLTIYLCLILNLLDKIGEQLLLRLPSKSISPMMMSIDGLDTFDDWLNRTETILK